MHTPHTIRVAACWVRLAAAALSFRLALRWGSPGALGRAARFAENASDLLLVARFAGRDG